MPRISIALTVLLLVLADASASEPVRLTVHPAAIDLDGPSSRHRILVTAVDASGQMADVTASASYSSSNKDLVNVSSDGECQAHRDGAATIFVSHGALKAEVTVKITGADRKAAPSFVHEVEPLFTRLGCNQGACHGKGAGQNGFRLSLRGYAPELDHQWLTREFSGRRVSTSVPDDSLILRKAAGLAAHEGGKLFSKNSRADRLLASWLAAGMPGPSKDDLRVTDFEILPGNRSLKPNQQQRLLARAKFSDGHWRDVTWLTRFDSNDPGMAEVDSSGLVTVLRPGETSIRASFLTQVAVTVVVARASKPPPLPTARPGPSETISSMSMFSKSSRS